MIGYYIWFIFWYAHHLAAKAGDFACWIPEGCGIGGR